MIPRSPIQAKGLLLAAIRDPCPILVLEPKILQVMFVRGELMTDIVQPVGRSFVLLMAVEQVPVDDYTIPGDVEVLREGTDLTLVSYGTPLYTCSKPFTRICSP